MQDLTWRQLYQRERRRRRLVRGVQVVVVLAALGVGAVYGIGWGFIKAFGG